MAKEKPFSVHLIMRAGLVGIETELSRHTSKAAAWRAAHAAKKKYSRGDYIEVRENGRPLIEVYTYRDGRKIWL